MRTKYIITFFFCIIYNSLVAQTTKYPEFKLSNYKLIASQAAIPYTLSVNFDLQPTSEAKREYEENLGKIEEFKETFEENRLKLEAKYNVADGDGKIQSAYDLIKFIIESEEEWGKLTISHCNHWEGSCSIEMNVMNMAQMHYTGTVLINLEVGQSFQLESIPTNLNGSMTGNSNITISVDFISGSGDFTSEDKLTGTSNHVSSWYARQDNIDADGSLDLSGKLGDILALDVHGEIQNGKTNVSVIAASPIFILESHGNDSRVEGYLIYIDPLTGGYKKVDYNGPVEQHEKSYMVYEFQYIEPTIDQIDFQKYKNQYFEFYVTAIDDVRKKQFEAKTGDLDGQEKIAHQTLNELLGAVSLGQSVGVDDFVFDKLSLNPYNDNSLFAKWFRLWFKTSDKNWVDKIAHSKNANELIDNLFKRLYNALLGERWIDAIGLSDTLKSELDLWPAGDFFTKLIIDYYMAANDEKCKEIMNNTLTPKEYEIWYKNIYDFAYNIGNQEAVAFISTHHR